MKKVNLLSKKSLLVLSMVVIGLGALPVQAAYAAGSSHPGLESRYVFLQNRFARQSQTITGIEAFIGRIQLRIKRADRKGLDTSAIKAALENLKAGIPVARSYYDQTATLIGKHPGFNSMGEVTDASIALKTLNEIQDSETHFRRALGVPFFMLREAIHDFRVEIGPF